MWVSQNNTELNNLRMNSPEKRKRERERPERVAKM